MYRNFQRKLFYVCQIHSLHIKTIELNIWNTHSALGMPTHYITKFAWIRYDTIQYNGNDIKI